MAKGNIGNLLQHFTALQIADAVVGQWAQPDVAVEYIDCFAMAPWEPITMAAADFRSCIRNVYIGNSEDVASRTLRAAYKSRYPGGMPTVQRGLLYPNTAALLRHGFPQQHWKMRLHDVDPDKQIDLGNWTIENHDRVVADVEGDWASSDQMERSPVPRDRPSLLMLDPNQVREEMPNTSARGFYLTPQLLANILGEHRLDFFSQDANPSIPQAALVFSYSEANADSTNRLVRNRFANSDLSIDRITVDDTARGKVVTHQGWVMHRGLPAGIGDGLQERWDEWRERA